MAATGLNHVSISASDLQASVRFYKELFGLAELPTPNFGFPVSWLRLGEGQLHLFERAGEAPKYHHLALTVDDFEAVYLKARNLGIFDHKTFGHHIYELPGNNVQMYIRDPAGNLIEVDWPNSTSLDRSVISDLRPLPQPQDQENLSATLFAKRSGSS